MHSQCWSGCNGHDLILGTIEMQTISGVDMIFKSIYVNECFTTMSTNFTAVDRVTKRNEAGELGLLVLQVEPWSVQIESSIKCMWGFSGDVNR